MGFWRTKGKCDLREAEKPKKNRVTVGTEVTCPVCQRVMVRCIKQPVVGQLEWADAFESVEFDSVNGKAAVCPFDGTPFYLSVVGVHVKGFGFTW